MSVQYAGGVKYNGGCSVHWRISSVHRSLVQYTRGYHEYTGGYHGKCGGRPFGKN